MSEESLRTKFQEQFEFLHGSNDIDTSIINESNFGQIITVLLQNMMNTMPNVAENACIALCFLAQGYESSSSSPLTQFSQEIVQSLLDLSHREDACLRTCAFEALLEVVRTLSSTDDSTSMELLQLVPKIVMQLRNTLEDLKMKFYEFDNSEKHMSMVYGVLQALDLEERNLWERQLCMLCECLLLFIQKLGSSEPNKCAFMQYADQIMTLLQTAYISRMSFAINERIMLTIGALAGSMGLDFGKYMENLNGYILFGIRNIREYQDCVIIFGVIGDICRALEGRLFLYSGPLIGIMASSIGMHPSAEPFAFSCFGRIALEIGEKFEKYLLLVMPMVQSTHANVTPSVYDDERTIEYRNSLRNGILEAYSGIFKGFNDSLKSQVLVPYTPHVLQFLDTIYIRKEMDEVMKTAISVITDLVETLGSNVAGDLIQQYVSSKVFLSECLVL